MDATQRREGWKAFQTWCASRKLADMPAHPWALAAYLRWQEGRLPPDKMVEHLKSIARQHLLRGKPSPERDPLIVRTLEIITARQEVRAKHADLFTETDFLAPVPANRRKTRSVAQSDDAEIGEETDEDTSFSARKASAEAPPMAAAIKRVMGTQPRLVRRRPQK